MINLRNLKLTSGAMAAAVSVTGLLALSGCEERPYPTAAKTSYEAPKAPPAQLAGAPATPPSYEAPRAPEPTYTPPAQTPPTYSAPAYQPRPYDPPAIVAMAPIPNPGEYGQEGYGRKGRRHGHYETGMPLPGLARVFHALGGQPWTVYRFLRAAHAELGGKTALDALKAGQVEAVLGVAENQAAGAFA